MFFSGLTFSSEYSQPGFYDVQHYVLENGLHVILKPRHLAHNVSIRLNVNFGSNHAPCGKRQTAHFLEHLLFTGTSKHSENELDNIIASHGGSWNAETDSEYTQYKIDIYNKHLNVGLTTLHEILTDSTISEENVEKSLNIIRREAGGKPGKIRNWLHLNGLVISATSLAMQDLFPGASFHCAALDNATSISREDILSAYKNYYIPQNMTLSLVGDFDIKKAKRIITETVGNIKVKKSAHRYQISVPEVNELDPSKIYYGRFSPLLNTEANVYQVFRIPGKNHKDSYVFYVLEEYFNRELYKLLRVKTGLAYSPSAMAGLYNKFGLFLLSSDAEIDDVDTHLKLISQVIDKFKQGKLDLKELEETKHKILLNAARGYETNENFAEYYVENIFDLKEYGVLQNYEDNIEKVSLKDIQRVSNKYFHSANRVVAVSSPTLTYIQLYFLILLLLVLLSLLLWRIVLHVRKKRIKTPKIC